MNIEAIINQVLESQRGDLLKGIMNSAELDESQASGLLHGAVESFGKVFKEKVTEGKTPDILQAVMQFSGGSGGLLEESGAGRALLEGILGGDGVLNFFTEVAKSVDLDDSIVSSILPGLFAKLISAAKTALASGGLLAAMEGLGDGGGAGGILGGLLDSDGDGSSLDDLAGLAKKLF